MDLKQFIRELETDDLYHYAKIYKDPKWKYFIFIERNLGCGASYEIKFNHWCEENCKSDYSVYNGCIALFTDEEDAVAFKLRWL